ncbi:endonuclease/exonuclease/phosphatase family protein [Ferruginivarius sediminum]|uniref:Endonuclease n=1 Tax=Ferruginivarius sediminum TaxID=2661937 RepID=A0A369TC43_9PROT|nr:endonuclease/exonuclease/phosphatase family protein [Ferruginivarius sediminum]RDD62848.1 endonuclease [Ferruginivarius sediminum]
MGSRLRIATFNLENLDDRPDADPPLDTRIAVLRPQLERLDADVLCLQEVNGQQPVGGGPRQLRALDSLLAETPYAGFHRVASTNPAGPQRGVADKHNLVILSRHPFSDWHEIRHDLVPAPSYRRMTAEPLAETDEAVGWERPVLTATVELPGGQRLHILNLHLRAPLAAHIKGQKEDAFAWKTVSGWAEGFFLAAVKRIGQAFEARLAVERIFDADPNAWICVCGDCNAEEREMPLRVLRADVGDTGNARLATRSLISLEQEIPPDRRYSVLHAGYKAMLDHLLASRALLTHLRGVEIHNEALGDELIGYASAHKSPESYHAPLVAEFAV